MNQFSPQCSLHWHWQHCELAPVVKEHISWYNDVENHSSFANIITLAVVGQHPTSWSSRNFNWNIVWGPHAAYNFLACVKKDEKNCVRAHILAFLSHFRFWKGICKVASWIGLEILIRKHPWKSKIGLLQLILAAKRYVTFFLGHPVESLKFGLGCELVPGVYP